MHEHFDKLNSAILRQALVHIALYEMNAETWITETSESFANPLFQFP